MSSLPPAILVWGVTESVGLDLDAIEVILMVIEIVGFVLSMLMWRSWWGPGYLLLDLRRGARSDRTPDNLHRRRAAAAAGGRPRRRRRIEALRLGP